MKNKLLLTACLLYLFNIASQAAPVTPNVAKQQAAIFLTQLSANSRQTTSRVASMQRMLTLAYTGKSASEEADYYVFNKNQSAGYIIISGDDRMPAVLGYSDSGTFNYNNIPDNMRAFLGEYAREAEYLRSHPHGGEQHHNRHLHHGCGAFVEEHYLEPDQALQQQLPQRLPHRLRSHGHGTGDVLLPLPRAWHRQ